MSVLKKLFSGTAESQQNTQHDCPTCKILLEQLSEARKREQRMARQLETAQSQIGQVITSKFETFNFSGPQPENNVKPATPLEMLSDVTTYDDQEFVQAAEKAVTQ